MALFAFPNPEGAHTDLWIIAAEKVIRIGRGKARIRAAELYGLLPGPRCAIDSNY